MTPLETKAPSVPDIVEKANDGVQYQKEKK